MTAADAIYCVPTIKRYFDTAPPPKNAEVGSLNGGKMRLKTGAEKFGLKYFGVTD